MQSIIKNLRSNHLERPLGLDVERLVLSWRTDSFRQTAAQIELRSENGPVWDSGQRPTDAPMLRYDGPALASRQRYFWRVKLWDQAGTVANWSEETWFETPPAENDWPGPWVAMEGVPTPLFRSVFTLAENDQPVKARWYLAVGGLCEARLNGAPVTDDRLWPAHTDYARRVTATTLDVTGLLRSGENVLGVTLGGGWFARHGYGRRCFRSLLEISTQDDRRLVFATLPAAWRVRHGPWLSEDIVHGEFYDARLEPTGWDQPGYTADVSWHQLGRSFGKPANAAEPPGGAMTGRLAPAIRMHESVVPVSVRPIDASSVLADFGRNLTGVIQLTGRAAAGTTLTIQMAEECDATGRIQTRTNKGARGVNSYTFRGDDIETWRPLFSYQGFRYAQVTGTPRLPADLRLEAQPLRNVCPRRAEFRCSHAGLTTLFEMGMRTIESNLFDLLSDCPQRDERQGWLADAWAVTPMVLLGFDVAALYRKWMEDMAGVQDDSTGWRWSSTAPPSPHYLSRPPRQRSRYRAAEVLANQPQADSVYTAALTVIPWQYHWAFDEPGHVARFYPLVAAHLRALCARPDFPVLTTSWHGDHAAMGWTMEPPAAKTPVELMAGAVCVQELRIAAAMARELGRQQDATELDRLAAKAADGLIARFFDSETGSFGSQTADAMALELGFAPLERRDDVWRALLADFERHEGRLTSGVVGSPYVLRTMSRHGAGEVVFRTLTMPGEPGFQWLVERGFTTLPEHIVSKWPDTSQNQPAWALIGEWMIRELVGIQPLAPGYAKVRVAPCLPAGVDWVEAKIETVRGPIQVRAERDGDRLRVETCGSVWRLE